MSYIVKEHKNKETCTHSWVVFSTCLSTVKLMVQCAGCGIVGVVPEPTVQEWGDAFHAPSNPYQWTEPERVRVLGAEELGY